MAKEIIEYLLVAIEELPAAEADVLRELAATTMQVVDDPALDDPTRSLAYVKFILCRSLPAVNRNGACWTYATLRNSLKTVANQVIDLNHHLEENSDLLGKKVANVVVGHMLSAEIDMTLAPNTLVAFEPIPLIVTGVINKRIAPDVAARLRNGEKLKISMECEYEDIGFWWDGKLWEQKESEVLWNAFKSKKKELNGKPIARVLGGVSPEGGVVNFWGAAILIDETPADPGAGILAAIASENNNQTLQDMEIVTMENNQPKVEETTQDTQLIHTVEEPPVVEVAITSEPGHLTPPTMVTDDLNKLNHQDLSLAEAINERIQLEVTKAVEEKINTLMSLATLNSGARQIIDPQNTDIDPNNDYADPGYNGDRTPKFPLNNRDQVLQAVSFFIGENNRDRYTGDQNSLIDKRISRAAAKFGLTEKDLTDFVNRAEAASEATEANTREESTMSDTINKPEMAASETASTSNELAATKKAIIDKLSSENASLKDQLNDLAKKMDDMTKNEQMRMKKDRAASRKKDMAKKLGEFDESMDSALASFVDEADDEEYTSFKAIAELIYDRGFTAGAQKIPSQEAIMASQGEPSPPTRKVTVIDPNPPAAMLPAPSGNPDTLKEGATVTTPFAPVAGSEMASSKKKNRFASL